MVSGLCLVGSRCSDAAWDMEFFRLSTRHCHNTYIWGGLVYSNYLTFSLSRLPPVKPPPHSLTLAGIFVCVCVCVCVMVMTFASPAVLSMHTLRLAAFMIHSPVHDMGFARGSSRICSL